MKFFAKRLFRWTLTPVAAFAGFAIGYIAWAAIEGAIHFFKFIPYVSYTDWLHGAVSTYLSAKWAALLALRAAPSHHANVLKIVLSTIFLYQVLQLCTVPTYSRSQQTVVSVAALEGLIVSGWMLYKGWKSRTLV
jgi:hypothetical protein